MTNFYRELLKRFLNVEMEIPSTIWWGYIARQGVWIHQHIRFSAGFFKTNFPGDNEERIALYRVLCCFNVSWVMHAEGDSRPDRQLHPSSVCSRVSGACQKSFIVNSRLSQLVIKLVDFSRPVQFGHVLLEWDCIVDRVKCFFFTIEKLWFYYASFRLWNCFNYGL